MEQVAVLMAILMAGAITGTTGFGFNLLSMPVLVWVYGPHRAVAISLGLGVITNAILVVNPRVAADIDRRLTKNLILAGAAGLPVGAWVFGMFSSDVLMFLIGITTISYGLLFLALRNCKRAVNPRFAYPAGALGGALAGSTGLSGPPVVLFMHALRISPSRFRSSTAAYVVVVSLAAVGTLVIGGQVDALVLRSVLILSPPALIGLGMGKKLFSRVSIFGFEKVVLFAILAMGAASVAGAVT